MSGFRPRFFAPAPTSTADEQPRTGTVITLDAEDSHHALRVLRLRPGDECEVVVGAAVYAATVLEGSAASESKAVRIRLGERLRGAEAGATYGFPVVLVQAVARPSALDWAVEKSTEAGVSRILVVPSAGSPSWSVRELEGRVERWARIAREAAKQSKQPAVPAVEICSSLPAAVERLCTLAAFSILLDPRAEQTLYELVGSQMSGGRSDITGVALWIGPEGGWSEEERESLVRAGLTPARLGRGVLRTETAGPVAVAVTRLALGDW